MNWAGDRVDSGYHGSVVPSSPEASVPGLPPRLPLVVLCATMGCGITRPPDKQGHVVADSGNTLPGHAPELVGFRLDFEQEEGRSILVASARLGDIDDNLVPGGSLTAVLVDASGRERTSLEDLELGTSPSELPEPTLLRVPFAIADSPDTIWEVVLTVTDRDGLSSPQVKAAWIPEGDTGTGD